MDGEDPSSAGVDTPSWTAINETLSTTGLTLADAPTFTVYQKYVVGTYEEIAEYSGLFESGIKDGWITANPGEKKKQSKK